MKQFKKIKSNKISVLLHGNNFMLFHIEFLFVVLLYFFPFSSLIRNKKKNNNKEKI